METILRATALAAILVMSLGLLLQAVGRQFQPEGDSLLRGFKTRTLAMELIRDKTEVERILGVHNEWNRVVMRRVQLVDFAFIASYWLLFTLSGALLVESPIRYSTFLGIAASACATIAALCDVWEDVFILKLTSIDLSSTGDAVQSLIDACRHAAQTKWSLLFLAMPLLSPLFLFRTDWKSFSSILSFLAGILLAATGAVGLITLPRGGAIEMATRLMSLTLLILSVVLMSSATQPGAFLSRHSY
jgi:hypothetical protein